MFVQAVAGGEPRVVVRNGYYGRFVETGHILYVSHGSVFAAPFDIDRLEVTGAAVQVVEGVSASAGTGSADFAVSRTGMLMYVPSKSNDDVLSSMDRSGATTRLLAGPGIWTNPVFSPDGGRLAMEISDGTHFDVWVHDLARATWTKITHEDTDYTRPVWTPDGRRVAFGLKRDGSTNLYLSRADGNGEPQRLTRSPNRQEPWSWHASGKFLSYLEASTGEAPTDRSFRCRATRCRAGSPASQERSARVRLTWPIRCSRRTGAGSRTRRMRPGTSKCWSSHFPGPDQECRSRPAAVHCRSGRRPEMNYCFGAPTIG